MITYNELLEKVSFNCKGELIEGGNQFDLQSRIEKNNIEKTVSKFNEVIDQVFGGKLPQEYEFSVIGSQGKKTDSGDIDTVLEIDQLLEYMEFEDVEEQIIWFQSKVKEELNNLGYSNVYNKFDVNINDQVRLFKGMSMVTVLFPQFKNNDDLNNIESFVQIDVLIGDQKWIKEFQFQGYFPEIWEVEKDEIEEWEKTQYKGVFRNFVLVSVLNQFQDISEDENGIVTTIKYNPQMKGLYKLIQKNITKTGRISKKKRTIDREKINMSMVDFFRDFLDDESLEFKDIQTFETQINYFLNENSKTKQKRNEILEYLKEMCSSNDLIYPEDYIEKIINE